MANRCPDCNKFVSLETQEPEVENLEVSVTKTDDGYPTFYVTADVHIGMCCAECGTELKAHEFNVEEDITDKVRESNPDLMTEHPMVDEDAEDAEQDDQKPSLQHGDFETDEDGIEVVEEGKGSKKTCGFTLNYTIKCACGEEIYSGCLEDSVPTSEFEEC